MPHTWKSLIAHLSKIATEDHERTICCPCCGNREHTARYGFYKRYNFDDQTLILVQRYRCNNYQCPRRTFSVLPHPFLRILRASLCMFQFVLALLEGGNTIAGIARITGQTWPRIGRWIHRAAHLRAWIRNDDAFSPHPCSRPPREWPGFVRDLSRVCYPGRC